VERKNNLEMNARHEARNRLEGRFQALVLEPSPPAVQEGPWFADDPTDPGGLPPDVEVVSPVTNADLTWDDLCRNSPEISEWCAQRWLGAWEPLRPLPSRFGETRETLHALAEHLLAPARQQTNGKIGLRYTFQGFGTPFFGRDIQLRIQGEELVIQRGEDEDRLSITSVAKAAGAAGIKPGAPTEIYLPTTSPNFDQQLSVDDEASLSLGAWFGFSASVLEQFRWDHFSEGPSRVQLWPEHFDLSVELGHGGASGTRAGYGASPGDENHPEPYLYVVPWSPGAPGQIWNNPHFRGASLGYTELLGLSNQRDAALGFFRRCFDALHAGHP
jgi:hypothetical protein